MLAALILAACLGQAEPLPVVVEHYDAIAVTAGEYPRAYFIRDGKIIADRGGVADWEWVAEGDRLTACWDEYATCHRRVSCDRVLWGVVVSEGVDDGPWWQAGRRMTDLKAP